MCSYNNQVWLYYELDLSEEEFDEDNYWEGTNLHIVTTILPPQEPLEWERAI